VADAGGPVGSGAVTIVAVFAHPDDESLACGGTLARSADAGARVVIVCASRGEAGSAAGGTLPPGEDLARIRTAELQRAADLLGVRQLVWLDRPDGELRWGDVDLEDDIRRVITTESPDAVITFDEDGLYWHPDHIGIHEQTTAAVRSLGSAAPPLYYVSIPHGVMRAVVDAVRSRGGEAATAGLWGLSPDAFGYAAPAPDFAIDVRPWMARKLAAIRAHRTQIGRDHVLGWIDEHDAAPWLGTEYFRRAPTETRRGGVLEPLAARDKEHTE
jgi:N-acetyl-1-D-myo-inositol-2-amino-2-deoxy-alpha-D-glucopyranoside deacetylase